MTIKIYQNKELTIDQKTRLFYRSAADYTTIKQQISPLMEDVRLRGDQAVREISARFGSPVTELKVTEQEFQDAYMELRKTEYAGGGCQ